MTPKSLRVILVADEKSGVTDLIPVLIPVQLFLFPAIADLLLLPFTLKSELLDHLWRFIYTSMTEGILGGWTIFMSSLNNLSHFQTQDPLFKESRLFRVLFWEAVGGDMAFDILNFHNKVVLLLLPLRLFLLSEHNRAYKIRARSS